MFKRNGLYYLLVGQGCCACKGGSNILVYTATAALGPYKFIGDVGSNKTQPFDAHSPWNYVTHAQQTKVRALTVGVLIVLIILSHYSVCVRALKGLALPQAWYAGDVSPPGRSRRSASRARPRQSVECMHALCFGRISIPRSPTRRACHYGKIALSGPRRLLVFVALG